jgi:hypothetical protein
MMFRVMAIVAAFVAVMSGRPAGAQSPSTIVVFVASGDSLTGCSQDAFFSWIGLASTADCANPQDQAGALYVSDTVSNVSGVRVIGANLGVSGTRLSQGTFNFESIAPTYIDPIVAYTKVVGGSGKGASIPSRVYIIDCAIGSNDGAIGSQGDPTDYAAAVASACVARKTAGFTYALMTTLLPRGDGVMTEPNRTAYNALLTSSSWRASNGIDGVIDFAGQSIIGNPANLPANNGGNTTYYNSDNIHYTQFGGTLLAPIIQSSLKVLLPGLFN